MTESRSKKLKKSYIPMRRFRFRERGLTVWKRVTVFWKSLPPKKSFMASIQALAQWPNGVLTISI